MSDASDERVLIVAPTGRDGHLLRGALDRAGIAAVDCAGVSRLVQEMETGVGAVVVTEEALDPNGVAELRSATARQAPWSDIPILLLINSRTPPEERAAQAAVDSLGNVTLLHRPLSVVVFVSAVRSALRTRRRQYEIRGYIAELNANSQAKDVFLAMLSHELRNPLSAIRNSVATAMLDESRRERALEIARRQVHQLGTLIDELLDVARITQGRIALKMARVYLAEFLEGAVDSIRPMVEERGQNLRVTLPEAPVALNADAGRLEQVMVNLLSNAAKYTDPGGSIEVVAERIGGDALIRVRDSGIGIAPEVLPRLFDLFVQAERALDRAQGGLGIGLTVARHIAQLHGGDVEARSAGLGHGAEFVVRLPALPPSTKDEAELTRPRGSTLSGRARVLIVEDNPDAAESLVMILEILGHRVRVVHDGVAALEVARANPPDLMLVDIGLPGIDGYDVARQVRTDPTLKDVTLVALTGYGREEDKATSMAAGFDHHLVKPVDLDALGDLVGRVGAARAREPRSLH